MPAGSYSLGSSTAVASAIPDPDGGRAFFYVNGSIKSFNLSSQALIASHDLIPSDQASGGGQLIRWGTDGLALLNYRAGGTGILLINGPFVKP
jgi:hypothetical protein